MGSSSLHTHTHVARMLACVAWEQRSSELPAGLSTGQRQNLQNLSRKCVREAIDCRLLDRILSPCAQHISATTAAAAGNDSHNKWLIKNKTARTLTAENIHEPIKAVAAAEAAAASSSASIKGQGTHPFASAG